MLRHTSVAHPLLAECVHGLLPPQLVQATISLGPVPAASLFFSAYKGGEGWRKKRVINFNYVTPKGFHIIKSHRMLSIKKFWNLACFTFGVQKLSPSLFCCRFLVKIFQWKTFVIVSKNICPERRFHGMYEFKFVSSQDWVKKALLLH